MQLPPIEQLSQIIEWLEKSKEFSQEVKRLYNWRDFLLSIPIGESKKFINDCIQFGKWFEIESQKHIGEYTMHLKIYLKKIQFSHKTRDDYIFCNRQAVEYHINMFGAELLSREYRREFHDATRKIVLLPGCMRMNLDESCKAKFGQLGLICASCNQECAVNNITILGKNHNFEVYIVLHESTAFTPDSFKNKNIGIVGISCVTRLIEGGWMAKELNLPPECVLLDYCGCKHWYDKEIPTDININKLKQVLNIDE